MALNLQNYLKSNNLPNLHYSNRTLSKGDSLKAAGGVPEADYAALVKSCDIIFSMVHPLPSLSPDRKTKQTAY